MSVYGEWQDATMTGQTSIAVDLGRDYEWVQIYIPTLTLSGNISFTVAENDAATYYTLGSGSQVITAGAGGFTTVATIGGFRYIKIYASTSQTAVTFRVRGSRR